MCCRSTIGACIECDLRCDDANDSGSSDHPAQHGQWKACGAVEDRRADAPSLAGAHACRIYEQLARITTRICTITFILLWTRGTVDMHLPHSFTAALPRRSLSRASQAYIHQRSNTTTGDSSINFRSLAWVLGPIIGSMLGLLVIFTLIGVTRRRCKREKRISTRSRRRTIYLTIQPKRLSRSSMSDDDDGWQGGFRLRDDDPTVGEGDESYPKSPLADLTPSPTSSTFSSASSQRQGSTDEEREERQKRLDEMKEEFKMPLRPLSALLRDFELRTHRHHGRLPCVVEQQT